MSQLHWPATLARHSPAQLSNPALQTPHRRIYPAFASPIELSDTRTSHRGTPGPQGEESGPRPMASRACPAGAGPRLAVSCAHRTPLLAMRGACAFARSFPHNSWGSATLFPSNRATSTRPQPASSLRAKQEFPYVEGQDVPIGELRDPFLRIASCSTVTQASEFFPMFSHRPQSKTCWSSAAACRASSLPCSSAGRA